MSWQTALLLVCASLGACGRGGSGGQPIEVPGALVAAVEQLEAERGDDVVIGTLEYSLATSPPRRVVLQITWSRYLGILVGVDLVGLPDRFVRSSASTWKPRGG